MKELAEIIAVIFITALLLLYFSPQQFGEKVHIFLEAVHGNAN